PPGPGPDGRTAPLRGTAAWRPEPLRRSWRLRVLGPARPEPRGCRGRPRAERSRARAGRDGARCGPSPKTATDRGRDRSAAHSDGAERFWPGESRVGQRSRALLHGRVGACNLTALPTEHPSPTTVGEAGEARGG